MQAARKMAEFISLIRAAVLREAVLQRIAQRLEISVQEFVKLLKAPTTKASDDALDGPRASEPIAMDPTLRFLAKVALRDAATREWILAEPWDTMLEGEPGADLLIKILKSDLDPNAMESLHVFLTGLNADEEAVVSGLLGEKMHEHPMHNAHDCWRELECRRIRHRRDSVQARMRAPDLSAEDEAKMQKEIVDLQKRLSDISRPLSPPL
jgi:DNA primase